MIGSTNLNLRSLGVVKVAAFLLVGCAGASTDPRQGGLAGGLNGLATGAYETRIAARQDALQQIEAAEVGLSHSLTDSRSRLARLDQHLAGRTKALQKLRVDLTDIGARLQRASQDNARDSAQWLRISDQIVAAKAETAALERLAVEQERRDQELAEIRRKAGLEAELREAERRAIPADRRTTIEEIERRAAANERQHREIEKRTHELNRSLVRLEI